MPAPGPFHSLTADDQSRLRTLLATGTSVAAAARQTGCHYGHALNFAHHHQLISPAPRPTITDTVRDHFLDVVANSHHSVNSAATAVGISPAVAYRLARQAGVHHQLTHTQRATLVTERRIEFLRLRLAGLHLADAATAVGVDVRQARDYDKGLTTSGSPRQRFLPSGGDARTYNRLMTALIERHDVIEHGRMAEPALPSGIDPYKPIHARYLNIHERALIADLIREGHTIRGIARRVGRSPSTISREIRRNHHAEGPYRPDTAQNKAAGRRLRPKTPKMLGNRRLYDYVVAGLRAQWSPEQIAYRIRRDHPDDQEMAISHETIYQAFYLAPKGRLADLGVQLPTGRKKRRLRCRARSGDTDRFVDKMVLIDHRGTDPARTLGRGSDHGSRQQIRGDHPGRTRQPVHPPRAPTSRTLQHRGPGSCATDGHPAGCIDLVVDHLGSGCRNGRAQQLHHGHQHSDLLLSPSLPLGTRNQRKHQRQTAA